MWKTQLPFKPKPNQTKTIYWSDHKSASALLDRISHCMFTWLLQSAKLDLLKGLIQGQGNDFQPNMQLFWWQKKQSRDHQHRLTLSRGSSSSISFLAPGLGSLFGSCSPLMTVTTPSLFIFFFPPKVLGIFPDTTYLGVGRVREGNAITFAVFLNKKYRQPAVSRQICISLVT